MRRRRRTEKPAAATGAAATGAATVATAATAATAAAMAVMAAKMGRIVDTAATIPADTGRFPPTLKHPYMTNIPKTTSRCNIALVHTSAHRSWSTYSVRHSTHRLPFC
jgi:hypothetical protein